MTRLLALVHDLDEADLACAAGADIVELDALAAAAPDLVRRLGGRARSCLRLAAPADAAVDYLRCDWPAAVSGASAGKTIGIVAQSAAVAHASHAAAAGLAGLMIDTTSVGRLLEGASIAALESFTSACRAAGLLSALGGSLEAPDIPRLLAVDPDILSFRGALRRNGRFDPAAAAVIRDLIPRSDAAAAGPPDGPTDRIFVRDFIVTASIGAYGRERGVRQRVRFNVEVDVARLGRTARDMRDIVSYDLVLDAIRRILDRGHVALAETLAEQVAAAILRHTRVVRVEVSVEKLDMIDGTLGVAISRTRADLTEDAG